MTRRIAGIVLIVLALALIGIGVSALIGIELTDDGIGLISSVILIGAGVLILLAIYFGGIIIKITKKSVSIEIKDVKTPGDLPGFDDLSER